MAEVQELPIRTKYKPISRTKDSKILVLEPDLLSLKRFKTKLGTPPVTLLLPPKNPPFTVLPLGGMIGVTE
jgi:hypothetical protein